jgi:aspartate/methionine/tyrosine aminotransferase
MKIDYLWEVKQHDAAPYRDLAGSGVVEPSSLMRSHFERYTGELERLLRISNGFGLPALRDLILERYGRGGSLDVQITNGASGAIWLTCQALLRSGDEVIIEQPVYEPLLGIPEYLGARVRHLPRKFEDDFAIDVDALAALVTAETRLIVLTNLHNPSGAWTPPALLQDLAERIRAINAATLILVDETFLDHVANRVPAATLSDRFISISSLTKVYGLFLLRCGWVMADPNVIDAIRRTWVLVENINSRLTEALSSIVLDHLDDFAAHSRAVVLRNRALVTACLTPLLRKQCVQGELPPFGSITFLRIPQMQDAAVFAEQLREQKQILVASGHHFGDRHALRIGFGRATEGLAEDMRELAAAITALS